MLYLLLFPALQDAEVQAFVWSLVAVGEANLQSLRTWKISWRRKGKLTLVLLSVRLWKYSYHERPLVWIRQKKFIKVNLISSWYCCENLSKTTKDLDCWPYLWGRLSIRILILICKNQQRDKKLIGMKSLSTMTTIAAQHQDSLH